MCRKMEETRKYQAETEPERDLERRMTLNEIVLFVTIGPGGQKCTFLASIFEPRGGLVQSRGKARKSELVREKGGVFAVLSEH